MKQISLLLTFALTMLVGFTSCDSTNSNGGTGTMEVTMTDAPANYDSVQVTINEVRVRQENDNDSKADETDGESEEDGWVTISDQQMTVNLLDLTNGSQVSLGSQELEAGAYSQIRLVLGDENTVTVDGET